MTTAPNPGQSIVDGGGKMTTVFQQWTQAINLLPPIVGTGSPEGVVQALQGQTYMDDAGTAGAILYIKRDAADIGGDKTNGWILV